MLPYLTLRMLKNRSLATKRRAYRGSNTGTVRGDANAFEQRFRRGTVGYRAPRTLGMEDGNGVERDYTICG